MLTSFNMQSNALLVIDMINDIVAPDGKIASCAKYVSEHPVITGVATNNAIDLGAREAWDSDYSPVIITDACGASDVEHHNAALFSLPPTIKQKTVHEQCRNE